MSQSANRIATICLLTIILIVSARQKASAQLLEFDSFSITSSGQAGVFDLPEIGSFISDTRDPALFAVPTRMDVTTIRDINSSSFQINFNFRIKDNPKHLFVTGFSNETYIADLYAFNVMDSVIVPYEMTIQNRDFNLRLGYQYLSKPDKKFSFYLGSNLDIGLPISAQTFQDPLEGDSVDFTFFSKRRMALGVNFPIGFQLKLLRTTFINFNYVGTFSLNSLDGTAINTYLSGANFGFTFKINDRK